MHGGLIRNSPCSQSLEPWALLDEAFAESDLPFKVDRLDAEEPGAVARLPEGSLLIQVP